MRSSDTTGRIQKRTETSKEKIFKINEDVGLTEDQNQEMVTFL